MSRRRACGLVVIGLTLSASAAAAQVPADSTPEPDADATIRFGPLSLKSTMALTNIGVDTNVFNVASNDNPQSDFTMTFTPVTDAWLRVGRTWINGRIDIDWVDHQAFASERSANGDYQIGVARTLNRLSFKGSARHLSTRERPGFEIDARSDRTETEWDGTIEMCTTPQSYVGARAWRRRVEFDSDEVFRGANLADQLNRTIDGHALTLRHVLTPLTTVSLQIGREQERFLFSPLRDSDSNRVSGSVAFQPLALISGQATLGYRHFEPVSADVPAYHGTTAAVALSYSLLGTTRFGVDLSRDVQPSLELQQPVLCRDRRERVGTAANRWTVRRSGTRRHPPIGISRLAWRPRHAVQPHRPGSGVQRRRRISAWKRQTTWIDDSNARLALRTSMCTRFEGCDSDFR